MASGTGQGQDSLERVRSQLIREIGSLFTESETIWDKLLEKQQVCTMIIAEQVEVNDKFTDYNDLYMERLDAWPDEFLTYQRFTELDLEVSTLGSWLSDFESRSRSAIDTIREMTEAFRDKVNQLNELRATILNASDLSEIESINLQTFQWVNDDLWPETEELDLEWRNKDLYHSINHCVLEMSQLFNTPADILAQIEHISEESSSPDSTEGIRHNT